MHPIFTAALFITAKVRKHPKCPSTDEMDKTDHNITLKKNAINICNEYYLAIKRIKVCHLQQHGWTWRALC